MVFRISIRHNSKYVFRGNAVGALWLARVLPGDRRAGAGHRPALVVDGQRPSRPTPNNLAGGEGLHRVLARAIQSEFWTQGTTPFIIQTREIGHEPLQVRIYMIFMCAGYQNAVEEVVHLCSLPGSADCAHGHQLGLPHHAAGDAELHQASAGSQLGECESN